MPLDFSDFPKETTHIKARFHNPILRQDVRIIPLDQDLDSYAIQISDIFNTLEWKDLPVIMKIGTHYLKEFSQLNLLEKRRYAVYILGKVIEISDSDFLPDDFSNALFKDITPPLGELVIFESPSSFFPSTHTDKDPSDEMLFIYQEQEDLERLRKQLTSLLEETEANLQILGNQLQDFEYMSSLSPKEEEEIRIKYLALNEDLSRDQKRFYQVLQKANDQFIQNMNSNIATASEGVTNEKRFNWEDLTKVIRSGIVFANQFELFHLNERKKVAKEFVNYVVDHADPHSLPETFIDSVFREISDGCIDMIMDQLLILESR